MSEARVGDDYHLHSEEAPPGEPGVLGTPRAGANTWGIMDKDTPWYSRVKDPPEKARGPKEHGA